MRYPRPSMTCSLCAGAQPMYQQVPQWAGGASGVENSQGYSRAQPLAVQQVALPLNAEPVGALTETASPGHLRV